MTEATQQLVISIGNFSLQQNFMFLSLCRMLPAKYFRYIDEAEPFAVFVNGKVLRGFRII